MLRFIDLFAGVGGLTEGFRSARAASGTRLFEPILLVDIDSAARDSQLRNNTHTLYSVANIGLLSAAQLRVAAQMGMDDDLDVLMGGPPCQGFSRLNRRTRRLLEDPRNAMFGKFLEFVRELTPKFVLIENVPNLLHFDGGRYRDEAFECLQSAGYDADAQVLCANQFGLPQLRRRAFIAAFRKDLKITTIDFPSVRFAPLQTAREVNAAVRGDEDAFFSPPFISAEEAIGDLPRLRPGEEKIYYACSPFSDYQAARRLGCTVLANHSARFHAGGFIQNKIKRIPEGGSNQDLDGRSRFDRGRKIKYLSQAYGRLHRHGIAQTITAHFSNPGSGRFLHYRDDRSITIREAARFQGFDDRFAFSGTMEEQQRQVGNAVPPPLARALAEHFGPRLLDLNVTRKVAA